LDNPSSILFFEIPIDVGSVAAGATAETFNSLFEIRRIAWSHCEGA